MKRKREIKARQNAERKKILMNKIQLDKLPNGIVQLIGDYLSVEDLETMTKFDKKQAEIMATNFIYKYPIYHKDTNRPDINKKKVKQLIISNASELENLRSFESLEKIIFANSFNEELQNPKYPSTLKTIIFGSHFNQPLKIGDLPDSLESLIFNCDSDTEISSNHAHYNSLISNDFNQYIPPNVLPLNLKILVFGTNFNNGGYPLEEKVFPESLVKLTFGIYFNNGITYTEDNREDQIQLPINVLPSNLALLTFIRNYVDVAEYEDHEEEFDTFISIVVPLPLTDSFILPKTSYNQDDYDNDIIIRDRDQLFRYKNPYNPTDNPNIFEYNEPDTDNSSNIDQPE